MNILTFEATQRLIMLTCQNEFTDHLDVEFRFISMIPLSEKLWRSDKLTIIALMNIYDHFIKRLHDLSQRLQIKLLKDCHSSTNNSHKLRQSTRLFSIAR